MTEQPGTDTAGALDGRNNPLSGQCVAPDCMGYIVLMKQYMGYWTALHR